jgi:hypothetical protein
MPPTIPHHLPTSPSADHEFQASIAATVALMTAWSLCDAEDRPHCAAMGNKIVAHLSVLAHHDGASLPMQRVMANVMRQWGCVLANNGLADEFLALAGLQASSPRVQ